MPLALRVYGADGEVAPDVEQRFFGKVRLPNGTWKTTYPNRLDDLNEWLLDFLPRGQCLRVMDVAVSSGISTLEWSDYLTENSVRHSLVAGDLVTDGRLMSWGNWFAVLFDDCGEPLLLEVRSLALTLSARRPVRLARPALSPLLRRIATRARPVSADETMRGGLVQRPISLVSPELHRRAGVEVVSDDVTVSGRFPAAFDVLRAANLVQPSYFDEPEMVQVIANLRDRVRDGGLLVLVRTTQDGTNRATIFRRERDHLREESSLNGGSEISELVLAL
ncbi:MAG: hypothetical protein WB507_06545 [Solirubrobacterales bacterium]